MDTPESTNTNIFKTIMDLPARQHRWQNQAQMAKVLSAMTDHTGHGLMDLARRKISGLTF